MKAALLFVFLFLSGTAVNYSQDFDNLAEAVIAKDTAKIIRLIDNGANINSQSQTNGATVLFLAASYADYTDMLEFLLKHGADVNMQGTDGKTALMWAAGTSLLNTKLLLENGADVKTKANDGMNPFIQSTFGILSKKVTTEVMDLLLKNGADINSELTGKDAPGWTALLFASVNGDIGLVKYLIEHGADVNHTSDEGETALSLAKQQKYKDIVALLRKHDAKD